MAIKIISGGKVKFQICAIIASQLSLTQAGCRDAKEVHFIMRSQELPTLS